MNDYNRWLRDETRHRKKYLDEAIKNKRYIRGTISARVKEIMFSRKTGDRTDDSRVRALVLRKTNNRCYLCGRQYTRNRALAMRLPKLFFHQLEIDHVVPRSKFGPNSVSNYMPACKRCNGLKSDLRLPEARVLIAQERAKVGY